MSDLGDSMSLAERVGQMTQAEFGSITPDEVAEWSIGSVLSGGGAAGCATGLAVFSRHR